MNAVTDLIAAALTLADTHPGDIGGIYHAQKDLQEMCARAMVQSVGDAPMPEADMRGPIGTGVYFNGYTPNALRTYGDAREAAGYAAGVAASGKDAERYRWLRRKFAIVPSPTGAVFHALNLPFPTYVAPDAAIELDAAIDAALRGEVK